MFDTQLIRCPTCGATNRVPQEKIEGGLEPICGRLGEEALKEAGQRHCYGSSTKK